MLIFEGQQGCQEFFISLPSHSWFSQHAFHDTLILAQAESQPSYPCSCFLPGGPDSPRHSTAVHSSMWPKVCENLKSAQSLSMAGSSRNERIPITPGASWLQLHAGTGYCPDLTDSTQRTNKFWSPNEEVKRNGLFNHRLLPSHPLSSLFPARRFRASQNQFGSAQVTDV
jgi:hypothetical protein